MKETSQHIVVEMDIDYSGHPSIEMGLDERKSFSFGIKSLRVQGVVEVILGPLLTELPVYGAMAISFVNNPEIWYDLTGWASVARMNFFKDRSIKC